MIATTDDIRGIRPIAVNLNDTKRMQPYLAETEKLQIIDCLGAKLYRAIDTNEGNTLSYTNYAGSDVEFDATEYSSLLNGGYYEYDDCTYYCGGLIPAIVYLAYARFVLNNSLNVTAFGVTVKQGQLSEPADTKAVQIHANESKKVGDEYLVQVYDYIKRKEGLVSGTKELKTTKIKIIGD